jgi:putative membrane protein
VPTERLRAFSPSDASDVLIIEVTEGQDRMETPNVSAAVSRSAELGPLPILVFVPTPNANEMEKSGPKEPPASQEVDRAAAWGSSRNAIARQRNHLMTRSLIAFGCLLLAGPALAQSVGEKTGVNSTLGIAPTTADFVKEAAISDMFEIASNKLAEDKGNASEKSFASTMVTDHTKTSTELKTMVSSGKVKADVPAELDSSHQSKLDKLKGESGKDFSSDFDSDQVSAHKDAVSLFERYAKGGDNADLKDWAGKTLPTLQHHLEMAQALSK